MPTNDRLQKALDKKNKTSPSFMTKSVKDMTLSDWEKLNATVSLVATAGTMFPLTTPIAAPIRAVTGGIGAGIDAYQSYDAYKKGDKVGAIYNAITGTAVGVGAFGSKFMPNTNIDEWSGIAGAGLDIADLSNASSKVSEIFEPKRKELAKSSLKPVFALGGTVMNRKINVENNEMFETPMGKVGTFKGATHKSGGIDTTVPVGTKIYSDQIKVGDHTMADRKAYRTKMITKLLSKHGDTKDPIMKSTVGRTLESFKAQEAHDLAIQDLAKETETEMYAGGTGEEGVKGTRNYPYTPKEFYDNQPNLLNGKTVYWTNDAGEIRANYWKDKWHTGVNFEGSGGTSILKANPAWADSKQSSPYYNYSGGAWDRINADGTIKNSVEKGSAAEKTLNQYYFREGNFPTSLYEAPVKLGTPDMTVHTDGTVPEVSDQDLYELPKDSTFAASATDVKPFENPPMAVPEGGKFGDSFTTGDYIGMASSVAGPVAQMINTLQNAKNTKQVVNHYGGVNEKAIQTTNEAIDETGYEKDIAKRALQRVLNMRTNSSRKNVRGSATSINSLRAMDLGVDTNMLEAEINANNQLEGTFGQQKLNLLGTRGQLESQASILDAQGQTQTDDANAANLDNFYTNFGQNLASMTEAGQVLGRNLNQNKYNKDFLKILPNANRWGVGFDKDMEMFANDYTKR